MQKMVSRVNSTTPHHTARKGAGAGLPPCDVFKFDYSSSFNNETNDINNSLKNFKAKLNKIKATVIF